MLKAALRRCIDLGLALAALPAAALMRLIRHGGLARLPWTSRVLQGMGIFPLRDHYYDPLIHPRHLRHPLDAERSLPGLDLDLPGQKALLGRLVLRQELLDLHLDLPAKGIQQFSLLNPSFGPGDAEFLYQYVRWLKPARVVEIGSGHSTRLLKTALERNRSEDGRPSRHICVEAYEMPWLEALGVELIREKVEACPREVFDGLGAGDLLFIDSSHIIRPQGDVLCEFLEILPRLKSGVHVHVHDIFSPRDYPHAWLFGSGLFFNEQYLLEAVLAQKERYQVVAALNHLKHVDEAGLRAVCPYLGPGDEPGSFYFKVR